MWAEEWSLKNKRTAAIRRLRKAPEPPDTVFATDTSLLVFLHFPQKIRFQSLRDKFDSKSGQRE
jgi:hypothetical protein